MPKSTGKYSCRWQGIIIVADQYIKYYNEGRLHSAIGYVAPLDKLLGRDKDIFNQRKLKLISATQKRIQASNEEK